MTDEKNGNIPDELELRSLQRFLGKKSMYDVEIAAEYDELGMVGWWSNYWNDWDELREQERYDNWFTSDVTKDVREKRE